MFARAIKETTRRIRRGRIFAGGFPELFPSRQKVKPRRSLSFLSVAPTLYLQRSLNGPYLSPPTALIVNVEHPGQDNPRG